MVVDSSAFVQIALQEEGWEDTIDVATNQPNLVGAPNWAEIHLVLRSRLGSEAEKTMAEVARSMCLQVVPFTPEDADLARKAFDQYGKRRHPAKLNFGDCMAYAVAKRTGEPLLYVGEDFSLTDLA